MAPEYPKRCAVCWSTCTWLPSRAIEVSFSWVTTKMLSPLTARPRIGPSSLVQIVPDVRLASTLASACEPASALAATEEPLIASSPDAEPASTGGDGSVGCPGCDDAAGPGGT